MSLPFGPGRPYLQVLDTDGTTVLKTLYLPAPDKGYGEVEWTKKLHAEWELLDKSNRERVAGYIPRLTLKWKTYNDLDGRGQVLGSADGNQARIQDLMAALATPSGRLRVCPGPGERGVAAGDLLMTGDGSTASAQIKDPHGNAVKTATIAALMRTDWQGGGRTNYSLQNTDLAHGAHGVNYLTIDPDAIMGPYGVLLDRVREQSINYPHYHDTIAAFGTDLTKLGVVCQKLVVKSDGVSKCTLAFYSAPGYARYAQVTFDLATGDTSNVFTNGNTGHTYYAQSLGGGWWLLCQKCTFIGITTETDLLHRFALESANAYMGDPSHGLFVGHMDIKCGPYADSDLVGPTLSTPVTVYDVAPTALSSAARTNKCLQSGALHLAPWAEVHGGTGSAPVVTGNYAASPKGTNTACRIQANRGAGNSSSDFSLWYQSISGHDGVSSYVNSIWLKSNTGSNQTITFGINGAGLQAVVVTPIWQQFSIVGLNSATGSFQVGSYGAVGGTNSIDILAWGGEDKLGTSPGAYIETAGSVVTLNDYTLNGSGLVTLGVVPAPNAKLNWSGSWQAKDQGFVTLVKKLPRWKLIGPRLAQDVQIELLGRDILAAPALPVIP